MKMNTRALTLASAAILIGAGSLIGQVVPQPEPVPPSSVSTNTTRPVSVQVPAMPSIRMDPYGSFSSSGSEAAVLVVPAGEMAIEDLAAANEDMTVMVGIFQRMMSQANLGMDRQNAILIGSMFGRGARSVRNIYLQGFGALFMMSVDFPLSPGRQPEKAPEADVGTAADPLWAETRQSIFEPERADRGRKAADEGVQYSAEKVETLKTTLIKSLKYAANIRALAASEIIVVTVTGETPPDGIARIVTRSATNDVVVVDQRGTARVYRDGLPDDLRAATPVILTIRAKVSDISAYAKGDSSFEQFRERVQVISCPQVGPKTSTPFDSIYGGR